MLLLSQFKGLPCLSPSLSLSFLLLAWHLRHPHSSGRAKTLDFTFWESTSMRRQCLPYRLQWGGVGGVALFRCCAFISGNINNPFHSLYASANPALRVTGVAGSHPCSLRLKVVLHPLDKSTVKCEAPSRPTSLSTFTTSTSVSLKGAVCQI